MKKLFTSIEIGSDFVKLVVAEMYQNHLDVLASACIPCEGTHEGKIVNSGLVLKSVLKAKQSVEEMIGTKLNKTLLIAPSTEVEYKQVKGYTTITNEEKRVTGNDIIRAMQASVYNKIDAKSELVTIIPARFMLDDEDDIVTDPKGLQTEKLTVHAVMITVPSKRITPIVSVLEEAGFEVVDIITSGIADFEYFKTPEYSNEIGVVINLGSQSSVVTYFEKGIPLSSSMIPMGGSHIDKDLSYVFNTSLEEASRIKERFALASKRLSNIDEVITVINNEKKDLTLNQYEVSEVVMARCEEILDLCKNQIKHLTNKQISYIILTGGVTELIGFKQVAGDIFGKGITLGNVKTMGVRNNRFSSILGNIIYFNNKLQLRGKHYSMFSEEMQEEIVTVEEYKTGEGVIKKVFDYFKID